MARTSVNDPFPDVIGTFMGRDALSLLVAALGLRGEDAVLLPAYLCREVSNPFAGKCRLEFYDLSPELVADPKDIAERLSKGGFKLLYMINYFGFLQPHRGAIKKICNDLGVPLVEDCAHSLLTKGSGETGDILVYSFRKILPLPDGGGLRLKNNWSASPRFHPQIYSDFLSMLSLAKSRLRFRSEILSRSGISSRTKPPSRSPTASRREEVTLPLSSYTRHALRNFDFPEMVRRRRADFAFWRDLTAKSATLRPLHADISSDVCPLGFPVFANDRPSLQAYLEQRGLRLRVHWPLPPEVDRSFTRSHHIASQLCTLPVYPDLTARERDTFAKLMAAG